MIFSRNKTARAVVVAMGLAALCMGAQAQLVGSGGQQISEQQIKDFFAAAPSEQQIAAQAAALGLTEAQISEAMQTGGYGGSDRQARDAGINAWVDQAGNGYYWDAGGRLVPRPGGSGGSMAVFTPRAWVPGPGQTAPLCPAGMTLGTNRAGAPKCFGQLTRGGPAIEAAVSSSQAVSVFKDPKAIPSNAGQAPVLLGNVSAQDWSPGSGRALLTGSGDVIAEQQVLDFFAGNPTENQIAAQAAALGLTQAQISTAMELAGYGGSDRKARDAAINSWVGSAQSGYSWQANGALAPNQALYEGCQALYEEPRRLSLASAAADDASAIRAAIASGGYYLNASKTMCAVDLVKANAKGARCHETAIVLDVAECLASPAAADPLLLRRISDWKDAHLPSPAWAPAPGFQKAPELANMADARAIIARGGEPILQLPGMFNMDSKELYPDYKERLAALVSANADLFSRPGVKIEIIDEIFLMGAGGVPDAQGQKRQVQAALDAIAAVKAIVPNSSVGVVVAPYSWLNDPSVAESAKPLLGKLDWISTDPYIGNHASPSVTEAESALMLQATKDFAAYVKTNAPGLKTLLLAQGFQYSGTTGAANTPEQDQAFADYVSKLLAIGAISYDQVGVWGWGYKAGGATPGSQMSNPIQSVFKDGAGALQSK